MPNWVKNIIHIEGSADDIAKAMDLMRNKNPEYSDMDIDFNNVIPMPERLNITSGGYDRYYVALYLKTLSMTERQNLRTMLLSCPTDFYGNYLRKYAESFTMDIPEGTLNRMKDCLTREYRNLSTTSMEDVGKAYIDNVLEYGADTWYDWCIDHWGTKWNACECTIRDNYLEFETAWSAPFPVIEELSRCFPELLFHHEWADEDLGHNCGRCEFRNGESVECEFDSLDEAREFACMLWGHSPDDTEA